MLASSSAVCVKLELSQALVAATSLICNTFQVVGKLVPQRAPAAHRRTAQREPLDGGLRTGAGTAEGGAHLPEITLTLVS